MSTCFLFHKWTKWQRYEAYYEATLRWGKAAGKNIQTSESRQKRLCEKCGLVQDVKV